MTDLPTTGFAPDFTTPEGLRATIVHLTAGNTWSTSPLAADLMRYATQKYTPVAKAWHRDPADAAYEAFLAMRTSSTVNARDPWAVITRAVALGLAAETHADRNLTSQDKARRPSKRPGEGEPVRAGHYEEFFYDVHPHATPIHDAPTAADDDGGMDTVIRLSCLFLVLTGWPAKDIGPAIDYLAHRIAGLSSQDAAIETVSSDLHLALRLGYRPTEWAGLVRLVIGTKDTTRRDGQLGLFARVLLGDTITDLLADPALVTTSQQIIDPPAETLQAAS